LPPLRYVRGLVLKTCFEDVFRGLVQQKKARTARLLPCPVDRDSGSSVGLECRPRVLGLSVGLECRGCAGSSDRSGVPTGEVPSGRSFQRDGRPSTRPGSEPASASPVSDIPFLPPQPTALTPLDLLREIFSTLPITVSPYSASTQPPTQERPHRRSSFSLIPPRRGPRPRACSKSTCVAGISEGKRQRARGVAEEVEWTQESGQRAARPKVECRL